MTKAEADELCMKLFGMNSDDYARRILEHFNNEEQTTDDMAITVTA